MREPFAVDALPDALDGERIDRIVALVADVPRSQAARLIARGGVAVDGRIVDKPSVRVRSGSSVAFAVERRPPGAVADDSVAVPVVHVDDHVIVVDKPAGLVVHAGAGVQGTTLVNGLLASYPELAGIGEPDRPGIVHRLDRGTSGLLMVARSSAAHRALSEQLRSRAVERRYRALVLGHVEAESGVIDAPLGRSPAQPTKRAVVADGRPARTHYEVLGRFGPDAPLLPVPGGERSPSPPPRGPEIAPRPATTLLRCRLETGRTHQIRAHLAAIGHPVAGDDPYGGSVAGTALAPLLDRPFLHAELLGFDHPETGERLRFTSPLPADLTRVLAAAGGDDPVRGSGAGSR